MYDDRDGAEDGDAEGHVAGLMGATGLGIDDEDMDEEVDGSTYGGE